jgi:hypothetical protein
VLKKAQQLADQERENTFLSRADFEESEPPELKEDTEIVKGNGTGVGIDQITSSVKQAMMMNRWRKSAKSRVMEKKSLLAQEAARLTTMEREHQLAVEKERNQVHFQCDQDKGHYIRLLLIISQVLAEAADRLVEEESEESSSVNSDDSGSEDENRKGLRAAKHWASLPRLCAMLVRYIVHTPHPPSSC